MSHAGFAQEIGVPEVEVKTQSVLLGSRRAGGGGNDLSSGDAECL